jgi:hypothetical protein
VISVDPQPPALPACGIIFGSFRDVLSALAGPAAIKRTEQTAARTTVFLIRSSNRFTNPLETIHVAQEIEIRKAQETRFRIGLQLLVRRTALIAGYALSSPSAGFEVLAYGVRKGFQRSNIAFNSLTSSGRRFGSGGRAGPAAIPSKFIASFMTETSYPLRRARSS